MTRPAFEIDRASGYFRVLTGLCVLHLDSRMSVDPPSYAEVARLVNRSGTEPRPLTAKAVERRLAYCAPALRAPGVGERRPESPRP